MEFIKQLWQNSIWLRIVVIVAVAGLVLMVVTHGSSGPPASYDESANSAGGISGKIDEVKQRLPGNGLPSKIRRVADKVVDVLNRSADKAEETVDKATEKIDDYLGPSKKQPNANPPATNPPATNPPVPKLQPGDRMGLPMASENAAATSGKTTG